MGTNLRYEPEISHSITETASGQTKGQLPFIINKRNYVKIQSKKSNKSGYKNVRFHSLKLLMTGMLINNL